MSYKGNLKVSTLSPTIPFIKHIKKKRNINVEIFDPYFTDDEIKKILNIRCFKFRNDLKKFDCLVVCMYPEYNQMDPSNPKCSEDSAYPANPDSEYG